MNNVLQYKKEAGYRQDGRQDWCLQCPLKRPLQCLKTSKWTAELRKSSDSREKDELQSQRWASGELEVMPGDLRNNQTGLEGQDLGFLASGVQENRALGMRRELNQDSSCTQPGHLKGCCLWEETGRTLPTSLWKRKVLMLDKLSIGKK
jgi:hypothetical protein